MESDPSLSVPSYGTKEEFLDCNVQPKNITTSGFLTLTCDTEPAADLTVNLIRLELSGNGAIQ